MFTPVRKGNFPQKNQTFKENSIPRFANPFVMLTVPGIRFTAAQLLVKGQG